MKTRYYPEGQSGVVVPAGSSISVRNLNVSFPGGKTVIRDLSLDIPSGQNVIVAGPNGCGKTTLLKCILGMLKPTSGSITISDKRPGSVAYCGQEKASSDFPISVLEVLKLGIPRSCSREESRKRIEKALELTRCKALANRNFFSLSGGEKQRASIARCLCQDPSLLLLDEPTTYLDVKGRDELFAILSDLAKTDLTIMMVTHENEVFSAFGDWRVIGLEKEDA